MDIQDLRSLLVLAEHEHITNASYELHMTPSTLSKRLARVEQELGVELFRRSSNRLSITEAGLAFRRHAERVLAEFDGLTAAMQHHTRTAGSEVHIGTYHFLLGLDLAPVLMQFSQAHPEVGLEVIDGASKNLLEMLDRAQIEVAFVVDHNVEPDRSRFRVYELPAIADRMCFVTYRGHPLAGKPVVELAALQQEPLILLDQTTADCEIILHYRNRLGLALNIAQYTDRHEVAFDFVSMGRGGTLYSEKLVDMYRHRLSNIVKIPTDPVIHRRSIMVVSKKALRRPATRVFVEHIASHCGTRPAGR